MLDPLKIVTKGEFETDNQGGGWQVYEVRPSDMYPATIRRIKECLKNQQIGEELVQAEQGGGFWEKLLKRKVEAPDPLGVARNYYGMAALIDPAAWAWAVQDVQSFAGDNYKLQARKAAQEVARLWFTQALHVAVKMAPIKLRILNEPSWRHKP